MNEKDFSNLETRYCYEWLAEEEVDEYHWVRQASQCSIEDLAGLLEHEISHAVEMTTSGVNFGDDLVAALLEGPMMKIDYRELAEVFREKARRDPALREYVEWAEEYEQSPGFSKRED